MSAARRGEATPLLSLGEAGQVMAGLVVAQFAVADVFRVGSVPRATVGRQVVHGVATSRVNVTRSRPEVRAAVGSEPGHERVGPGEVGPEEPSDVVPRALQQLA